MRRESRKGRDRRSPGGRGRDTAWVCVWRRPCWRDTAGYPPRPQLGSAARRRELPLARPTFYTAQRRAAMHDARCTPCGARCTRSPRPISTPSISIRFTSAGRTESRKKTRARDRSKWSPMTAGLLWPAPCFSAGEKFIFNLYSKWKGLQWADDT